jgi:hypothetical protein
MEGIGYIRDTQTQHLVFIDDMQRGRTGYYLLFALLCNDYFAQLMRPVRNGVVTNHLTLCHQRQQTGQAEK